MMAAHKASLLVLFAALLPQANATAEIVSFPSAELIKSCYYKDARYYSPNTTKTFTKTIYECQEKCVQDATCGYFGWWPSTGSCYHAGPDAVYTEYLAEGGYTGPKVCPSKPTACTDLPSDAFPGDSEDASKLAWPSHRVPQKLACWPKDYIGKKYLNCPTVEVLEDTETGWPGKCYGLDQVVVPMGETCQSACSKKVSCSTWQEVEQPYPIPAKCYHSYFSSGRNCYTRNFANGSENLDWKPKQSQRIMHGEVRVLMTLKNAELEGLYNAFDQNYFIKVEDAISACKASCYSDVGCQWWIYNKATGCWVEDINYKALPVPITTAVFKTDTKYANAVAAGEYIQHVCSASPVSDLSSTQSIPEWTNKSTEEDSSGEGTTESPETASTTLTAPLLTDGDAYLVLHPPAASEKLPLAKGAMSVLGVSFDSLTIELKQQLAIKYAELIASQVGVDTNSVLDEHSKAGQTTIESWTKGTSVWRRRLQWSEGIGVPFQVILKVPGQAGVSEALNKLSETTFTQTVGQETWSILKDTPGALLTPGTNPEVQVALRESAATSGLDPNGVAPSWYKDVNQTPAPTEKAPDQMNVWKWIVLILVVLLIFCCIFYLCFVYYSKNFKKAKVKGTEEEDTPLFGAKQGDLFDQLDTDGDGVLSREELAAMRKAPLPPPAAAPPLYSTSISYASPMPAPVSYVAAAPVTSIKAPVITTVAQPVVSTSAAPMYQSVASPTVRYSSPTAATTNMVYTSTAAAPRYQTAVQYSSTAATAPALKSTAASNLFDQLDTDGDGVLSREELAAMSQVEPTAS